MKITLEDFLPQYIKLAKEGKTIKDITAIISVKRQLIAAEILSQNILN